MYHLEYRQSGAASCDTEVDLVRLVVERDISDLRDHECDRFPLEEVGRVHGDVIGTHLALAFP